MKKVGIVMGSDSDLPIVEKAMSTLSSLGIPFEVHVYSAHRTPAEAGDFAANARANGFGAIIAAAVKSSELVSLINSDDTVLSTNDFMSINYLLTQVGYKVTIWNVADDEENAAGVPSGEVVEWNVVNRNFMQNDYPTATKLMPDGTMAMSDVLKKIVDQCGLFNSDKFEGIRNPFTPLLNNLEQEKKVTGRVNAAITTQIYNLLSQMGIDVFCAISEE